MLSFWILFYVFSYWKILEFFSLKIPKLNVSLKRIMQPTFKCLSLAIVYFLWALSAAIIFNCLWVASIPQIYVSSEYYLYLLIFFATYSLIKPNENNDDTLNSRNEYSLKENLILLSPLVWCYILFPQGLLNWDKVE